MDNKLITQLQDFFNKYGCRIETILENRDSRIQYSVSYRGKNPMYEKDKWLEFCDIMDKYKVEIFALNNRTSKTIPKIVRDLGYKTINQ